MTQLFLGVNVDHVATLRQQRKGFYPDPTEMAVMAEMSGAWGITAHLREDRRHIQTLDIERLAATVKRLNMEMAVTEDTLGVACRVKPYSCCLVPERRQELTTEGGLDVVGNEKAIAEAVARLHEKGIIVSTFIDPEEAQIQAAARCKTDYIELHTGKYANLTILEPDAPEEEEVVLSDEAQEELQRLIAGAQLAHRLHISVNAGHGIDYHNIHGILQIPHLRELNIGYSIISRALFIGLPAAVCEMLCAMSSYPAHEEPLVPTP